MGKSYINLLVHYIFSTKHRLRIIEYDLRDRLYEYIGGIARENKMKLIKIGGTQDHLHLLLSLPQTLTPAKAIKLIKGSSSNWVQDTFPKYKKRFAWQEGYGAFSVSNSQLNKVANYIENQEEHHRLKTFEEEFNFFLTKNQNFYNKERFS